MIGLCLGMIALVMLSSCKKEEEGTTDTIETTTTTNTIETDTVIVKEQPAENEGTSVKIDSNGVQVDSKKLDVKIK